MGTVSTIKQQSTPSLPTSGGDGVDRSALRAAFQRLEDARANLASHLTAVSRASKMIEKAEARLEKTKGGIADAKQEASRFCAEQISLGVENADGSSILRAARAALESAEDDVDALRSAHSQLRIQTVEHRAAVAEAEVAITVAVRSMLEPRARAALARLRDLEKEILPLLGILHFVELGDGAVMPHFPASGWEFQQLPPDVRGRMQQREGNLQAVVNDYDNVLRSDVRDYLRRLRDPMVAGAIGSAWRQCAESLRKDAEAALPT